MKWDSFHSNIKKNPKDLGLDLGLRNCLAILDMPYGLITTDVHDLGESYIQSLENDQVLIKVKEPWTVTGVTQVVVFLDRVLTAEQEETGVSNFFSYFTVNNHKFTYLSEDAIKLIFEHKQVVATLNSPEFTMQDLESQQIVFYEDGSQPIFGEPYLDQAILLKKKLNLM